MLSTIAKYVGKKNAKYTIIFLFWRWFSKKLHMIVYPEYEIAEKITTNMTMTSTPSEVKVGLVFNSYSINL